MKKILISLLLLIFIISTITTVYAATGDVKLSASTDTVFKGKTFTVTLTATGENNVTGISSKLSYDKSKLSLENKTTSNGFTDVPSGDELNAGILSTDGITLSKSVVIYTLTFKVLDTASVGETEISLTNIELGLVNESGVQEDVTASNTSVKISIKEDDTTVGGNQDNNNDSSNNNNNANNGDNNNTNSGNENKDKNQNKNVNSNKNTNKNNNKNTTKLPQTGAESTVVIAIIALGIVSIVSYISYRKYNNI